ncbi:MAG: DUF6090 family protein, partial [Kordia sp.]|uniref:DUF6090 family protein n=1 Tax=Kordia sp. TaxID=1965332 RepID=UPI00385D9D71
MIKFFRRIRQDLLSNGKTGKYFKYALGEIILVVIGILIALSINNWNDKRIKQKKEIKYISQIHEEFLLNRAQLDTATYYHLKGYKNANKILAMMPINIESVNLDSLSYYIEGTLDHWTFNPQQTAIISLSSTSSFDIISNNELRVLLQNWTELVSDYQEEENTSKTFSHDYYLPYLRQNIAFKNYANTDETILKHSKIDLNFLNELEFENLIHNRMIFIEDIVNPPG